MIHLCLHPDPVRLAKIPELVAFKQMPVSQCSVKSLCWLSSDTSMDTNAAVGVVSLFCGLSQTQL